MCVCMCVRVCVCVCACVCVCVCVCDILSVMLKAKLLAVEVYRWMGAPLRGILEKNLKPVQVYNVASFLPSTCTCTSVCILALSPTTLLHSFNPLPPPLSPSPSPSPYFLSLSPSLLPQIKDLDEEWSKLPGNPATPTRLLRSQQVHVCVHVYTLHIQIRTP